MKADALYTLLGSVAMMTNKHALSAKYRALYLSPKLIMAVSSYAVIEIDVELGGLTGPCFVDTTTFLAVLNSMPAGEEVVLKQKNDVINWKCGSASGKLSSMALEEPERINRKPKKAAWPVQLELAEALDLGALSCDNNTLAAIGMYGVVLDNRNGAVVVYSCDNVTVSLCHAIDGEIEVAPELMTLAPEAASLLSAVIKRGEGGKLEFSEQSIYYRSNTCRLLVAQSAPLKQDIAALLGQYKETKKNKFIEIPPTRIAAFVARVNAIAESRKDAHVELKVEEGRIALSFTSSTASSDEFYMAEGLGKVADMPPVSLKADKLARALRFVQTLDVTHVDRQVVILRGDTPSFRYLIAGSKAE